METTFALSSRGDPGSTRIASPIRAILERESEESGGERGQKAKRVTRHLNQNSAAISNYLSRPLQRETEAVRTPSSNHKEICPTNTHLNWCRINPMRLGDLEDPI
jgi:hypothetical protein